MPPHTAHPRSTPSSGGSPDRRRAAILISALGVAIIYALAPFVAGLIGTAVLYVLCVPSYRWLARRLPPTAAAAIVLLATVVLVLVPTIALVTVIIAQAPSALQSMVSNPVFTKLLTLKIGHFNAGAEIASGSGAIISWTSGKLFNVIGGATRSLLLLTIALFGLFFLLLSADTVWAWCKDYLPFSDDNAESLRHEFYLMTQATVIGTLLTAGLQGAVLGVGLWIFGIPYALFWGVGGAFLSVLPLVGSVMWLPGSIALAIEGHTPAALGLAAFCLVGAFVIDNIVRPLVLRRVSNVHPMLTLLGAFGGIGYFGLLGVLVGPLALSYFFELLRMYRLEYGGGSATVPVSAPTST